MLILTRRPSESIHIGEQVIVTVLGIIGNQVRFGIEAPRSISIDRAEIYERKKREPRRPANGNMAPPPGDEQQGSDDEPNGNIAPDAKSGT